jgi:hypothetical protein
LACEEIELNTSKKRMDVDLDFTKGLNSIVQFAMNCVKFMILSIGGCREG